MKKYILFILGIALSGSAAITIAPKRGVPEGNRFLFILDISSSMRRVEHGGRQVVFDLVHSGIENRMQAHDTFGVWTFGEEIQAGVYPVQVWKPTNNVELASEVGRFLKGQSKGRKSVLDAALSKAESLARSVRDVDILIVTSAAGRFKDDDTWTVVHQAWKSRLEEAKKGNKAMIIALAARSGQFVQATVTLQGEPLQLLLPLPRRPAQVAKKSEPAPEPPPKAVRESIIMQGSPKPKPIDQIPTKFVPAPVEAPEPVQPAIPDPVPVPVPANTSIVVVPTQPVLEILPAPIPVAAREPAKSTPAPPRAAVSPRTLIMAGGALMLIAGLLGGWLLMNARSRTRVSYISQSMGDKPADRA